MRVRSLLLTLAMAGVLAACGESGSSSTGTGSGGSAGGTAGAQACAATPGQELVVLEDDKKLQTVDNVIPAINAKAATPPLVQALDKVSDALTTEKLVDLNRQVSVERKTSPNVAKEFVAQEKLTEGLADGSGTVVIGAANFAENQTLAAIYEQVLDAAGFAASSRTIGNRELFQPALQRGEIQVVPEYVGTLTEFLNKRVNGPDAKAKASSDLEATLVALKELGASTGLAFGKPSEAADQNAFAVTKAFADKYDLTTLSDLAKACTGDSLVLGGPAECPQRPFCQPGLQEKYGLTFKSFTALDAGGPLTQTALKQGKIHVGLVFSSDGGLTPR